MSQEILNIEKQIFSYVVKNSHTDADKINKKTLLFKEGVFDSMAFVLLIDFLEQQYQIKIEDTDLIEENFKSIEAISLLIYHKLDKFMAKYDHLI